MKNESADILIENLRVLMKITKLSHAAFAKKSGISPRMIAYILSKERIPTVDSLDALAQAFGLKGWQLLIPGIKPAIAESANSLIKRYVDMNDIGRAYIDHVAEKEAKYKTK